MTAAKIKPNSLVASARILTAERINTPKTTAWQEECWGFYDLAGELWFADLWLSNALSKLRLFAAWPPQTAGDEPEPIESGPAVDLMEQFAGGVQGQSRVMADTSTHLTIPGEGYLIGRTDDEETSWRMCSNDEIKVTKNQWNIRLDQAHWEPLPPESLVIKIWQHHKRRAWLSDSPTRHALPALREIQRCNEHIDATLVSRLAGSGLLIMPSEVTFPVKPENADKDDPFFWELLEAMTAPIKDRGTAAAVVPLPVRVPGERVEQFKHLSFATLLDQRVLDLRERGIQRFATTVDFPSDILLGKTDMNHWCVDDQTEILTEEGWRTQGELAAGDRVLTLNHETGLSEWQSVSNIYRADVDQEPMLAMETANHSSLTTLNHRWPVTRSGREWCQSKDLSNNCRIPTAAPCADQPVDAKWSDDLVELVAWTWTEGHVSPSKSIMLAQSAVVHPEYEARIRRCLTRLYGPAVSSLLGRPAWRERIRPESIDSDGVHHHECTLFFLNAKASAPVVAVTPDKHVDLTFIRSLTIAQLDLFISVSLMGDGRHPDRQDITQRHASQLDAFDLAAILVGRTPIRGSFPVGDTTHHSTALHRNPYVRPKKTGRTEVVEYTGTIWCPVTPNQTWLARRNGKVFYTGNTAWQVSEEGLQMHIEPKAELIVGAFTKGFLKPSLMALGRAAEGQQEAIIWFDSSELKVRPDRSADARWLHDGGVIGSSAALRETGMSEADRPTLEEYRQMVAWKLLGVRDMGPLALSLLGIDYDKSLIPMAPGQQAAPGESGGGEAAPGLVGPDTKGPDTPGTTPPPPIQGPPTQSAPPSNSPDLPSRGASLLVADQLVYRALERAGNRLRSLRKGKLSADQDCPPATMHECLGGISSFGNGNGKAIKATDLLEGAWERVPEAAEALGEDPVKLQRALQRYCIGLLTTGQAHTCERLSEFLVEEMPPSVASLVASAKDGLSLAMVVEMNRGLARLADTMARQVPPVIQFSTPPADVHLDGPVSVTSTPPRTRRLERDTDGNITKIIEEA